MKEEDALPKPPEGRGPKLSGRRLTLSDAVSEPVPHVVERKIREEVNVLSTERCDSGHPRSKRRRVAQRAANSYKELLAIRNGSGPARRVW